MFCAFTNEMYGENRWFCVAVKWIGSEKNCGDVINLNQRKTPAQ